MAAYKGRLSDTFFKREVRRRQQEEMQNAEKWQGWGGLLIKRARMCEARQPGKGEKSMK